MFERIGSGCFGEVFRGKELVKSGETIECAIKIQKIDKISKDKILIEASLMK